MDPFLSYFHPEPGWNKRQSKEVLESNASSSPGMLGKHCILEMYECNKNKLNDEAFVRTILSSSAKLAGARLINMITHRFVPQGITGLALLAESHISIHSWPEIGYGAVDIFTCGEHTHPKRACANIIQEFESKRFHIQNLQRQTPHQLLNVKRKTNI